MKSSRRSFLRHLALGGAATCLPLTRMIERAVAQPPGVTPRVVFFHTNHGPPPPHWQMAVPGLTGSDSSADLTSLSRDAFSLSLEPLYDVRQHIHVLQGMAMVGPMLAAAESPTGNNHGISWATLSTNAPGNYSDPFIGGSGNIHPRPTSASIDQHIARATAPAGKLPSVVWGQATGRFGSQFGYAIDADGSWVPVESSPSSAYGRLVDNGLSATDPTPGPTPVEPTRAERIAAMRARMLGVAAADFDRVVPTLGDEDDRRRLARHAESIRALETRWTVGPGGGPIPTPAACDPRFDADGDRMDAFFRLTALALSCDVTRVVSLNLPQLRSAEFGAPPTEDVHERYAHGTDAESVRWMGLYYRYHASQFASLVSYLAAMPDGDGTLLDSTMVVWVPELATGNHGFNDAFAMVAGGRATGLQLGRYTRFAQNRPTLCSAYGCRGEGIGPGHSHLYVSAMQHMGMSEDVFGRRTGRTRSGGTIDLSGPLPFLRG